MRKILSTTTILLVLMSLPVISQDTANITRPILKGNFIVGGDLRFDFSNYFQDVNYSGLYPLNARYKINGISLSISPEIGYFIIDGLAIGISPSFSYSYSKSTALSGSSFGDSKGHSLGTGVSVFLKYYLRNCIFFEIESGYLHSKDKNTTSDPSTYNNYSVIPSIGYAIFVNSKVSIEPKINYEFNYQSIESSNIISKVSENGISLSVGFPIFF
jgi:hypothetical protein